MCSFHILIRHLHCSLVDGTITQSELHTISLHTSCLQQGHYFCSTPDSQLWIFFENVEEEYGIDMEGPIPSQGRSIVVPEVPIRLSSENFALLQQAVNPLAPSDEFGIDLYEQVLQFMSTITV